MRILQMEDEPWDSGLAVYALVLSRELQARGHRVVFWGRAGSPPCRLARGWGLETVESRPWLGLASLRRLILKEKIQLVNAHTGSAHSLAIAATAGLRVAVVRTRGDARPARGGPLARGLARRTTAFIAANTRIARDLRERFHWSPVRCVPQGMPEPARRHRLPGKAVVGLLGRLDPVKGHADFLAAAASLRVRFPEAHFSAAGGGASKAGARLKALADSLGLGRAVDLPGRVPSAEEFIGSCRIGVIASRGSEAVSRAALEWMAQGRPLVATYVGCLPDLVKDGETGFLVPPKSPAGLAAGLARLLADPALAQTLGDNGRARFQELYTTARFAADTEKVYEYALHHLPS